MRMLEKNSYITDQIQEERQVSFYLSYKGVKAKVFIFIKKDITIWLKLGRFVIVYDLTKWVKPLFLDFFFLSSAFNRSGLICS